MSTTVTTTLFTELPDPSRRPASLAASMLAHSFAVAVLLFGVFFAPRIDTQAAAEHFLVRTIALNAFAETRSSFTPKIRYPEPRHVVPARATNHQPASRPSQLLRIPSAEPGPQTILQPELLSHLTISEEVPIPHVVIWSPSRTLARKIVPPNPAKPTAAEIKPAPDPPNEEVNLSSLGISAAKIPSKKLPLLPSTTSPVAVHGPNLVQLPPVTAVQAAAQPTPASVVALSDLRMTNGSAALPPVNETSIANSDGPLQPGATNSQPHAANGTSSGSGNGNAAAGNAPGDPSTDAGDGYMHGSPFGQMTSTRITQPANGHFGAVVIGDSVAEEYPEIGNLWGGRMAYTVYIHVGLAKSWILQYSLPRDAEAAGGFISGLEAPWPTNIVRPNLAPGAIDADALLVHGFIDQGGRFESLHVVFPPEFEMSPFVLKSLAQWQFRPASEHGQIAKVEVLLIIPDIEE